MTSNVTCAKKKENKNSFYLGETSRTLYTRINEYIMNSNSTERQENRPLIKHNMTFHPGHNPNFDITAVSFHKDPLSRQIHEGIRRNNTNFRHTIPHELKV